METTTRELSRISTNEGFFIGSSHYTKTDMTVEKPFDFVAEELVCLNRETNLMASFPANTQVTPDMEQFTMDLPGNESRFDSEDKLF